MDSIKVALKSLMKKFSLQNRVNQGLVCLVWNEVVGDEISKNTYPSYINSGILFVIVRSSSWAHQLTFLKGELIRKINARLGERVVKDIRFQVGYVERHKDDVLEQTVELENLELDENEVNEIIQMTERIRDEDLQQKLRELLIKHSKYCKLKARHGSKPCLICGVLTNNTSGICSVCILSIDERRINKAKSILREQPWITYDEMKFLIPALLDKEYNIGMEQLVEETRKRLDEKLIKHMTDKNQQNYASVKECAYELTFLVRKIMPIDLSEENIRKAIGDERYNMIFNMRSV